MRTARFYCHLVWGVWCFLQGANAYLITSDYVIEHISHSVIIIDYIFSILCISVSVSLFCLQMSIAICDIVSQFLIARERIFFSVTAKDYIKLSHDGPVVLGGTITFRADLYRDGERPRGTFRYKWSDNSLMKHEYQVIIIITIIFHSLRYSNQSVTRSAFVKVKAHLVENAY